MLAYASNFGPYISRRGLVTFSCGKKGFQSDPVGVHAFCLGIT